MGAGRWGAAIEYEGWDNSMNHTTIKLGTLAVIISLVGCAPSGHDGQPASNIVRTTPAAVTGVKDIITTATKAERFSTFVKAVDAADLFDALKNQGPFTVFAPTDDAFDKLPAATRDSLFAPGGKDRLKEVVSYHIVRGKVTRADLGSMGAVKPILGKELMVSTSGGLKIDGTNVVETLEAANGIIHVVDKVLMPR
jgi:uncharacterized surface protein with fasciclin (FAS1) repeats